MLYAAAIPLYVICGCLLTAHLGSGLFALSFYEKHSMSVPAPLRVFGALRAPSKWLATFGAASVLASFCVFFLTKSGVFDGLTRAFTATVLSVSSFTHANYAIGYWLSSDVRSFTKRQALIGYLLLTLGSLLVIAGFALAAERFWISSNADAWAPFINGSLVGILALSLLIAVVGFALHNDVIQRTPVPIIEEEARRRKEFQLSGSTLGFTVLGIVGSSVLISAGFRDGAALPLLVFQVLAGAALAGWMYWKQKPSDARSDEKWRILKKWPSDAAPGNSVTWLLVSAVCLCAILLAGRVFPNSWRLLATIAVVINLILLAFQNQLVGKNCQEEDQCPSVDLADAAAYIGLFGLVLYFVGIAQTLQVFVVTAVAAWLVADVLMLRAIIGSRAPTES